MTIIHSLRPPLTPAIPSVIPKHEVIPTHWQCHTHHSYPPNRWNSRTGRGMKADNDNKFKIPKCGYLVHMSVFQKQCSHFNGNSCTIHTGTYTSIRGYTLNGYTLHKGITEIFKGLNLTLNGKLF